MATEFIDPEGRRHWAEESSEFAKSGLASGFLRRAGDPVAEQADEAGGEQGDAEGENEQADEAGGEAEDATVEPDGDGEDAVDDPSGSGDAKPARRGSRRR